MIEEAYIYIYIPFIQREEEYFKFLEFERMLNEDKINYKTCKFNEVNYCDFEGWVEVYDDKTEYILLLCNLFDLGYHIKKLDPKKRPR